MRFSVVTACSLLWFSSYLRLPWKAGCGQNMAVFSSGTDTEVSWGLGLVCCVLCSTTWSIQGHHRGPVGGKGPRVMLHNHRMPSNVRMKMLLFSLDENVSSLNAWLHWLNASLPSWANFICAYLSVGWLSGRDSESKLDCQEWWG